MPEHAAEERRPSIVPLVLVVLFVAIAAVAASRGGTERPSLDAVDAEIDGSTDTITPGTAIEPGVVDTATEGETDAEVLGTSATPSPGPSVRAEDLPMSGTGDLTYADRGRRGWGARPFRRFKVAAEIGSGVDVDELAAFVDTVLSDPRSWIGDGVSGFRRVGAAEEADFTLVVATPDTVDQMCFPLETGGRYSCGANGWIALNLHRWMTATPQWPASLEVYRQYLVNHEFGHYVLGPDHEQCPAPGTPAPIMMQQTIDLQGCLPNGWVFDEASG